MTGSDPISSDQSVHGRIIGPSQSRPPDSDSAARLSKRLLNSTQADQVSISTDDARLASKLHDAVRASSDVRESRIEEIRAAIANGTYQVDPREIAQAMLSPNHTRKTVEKQ
ncbi:MAG TPA: flagellar biosynthesis anti-sigma factor FlgM [Chloroflexota bacterium]|nr:flagellar biosynthesis anti-sigma factor FlgM [Chloroflexota bacterium]